MEKPIIELKSLSKTFSRGAKGKKTALAGLSLSVKRGEVFGLLGPNGAGKTTTLRMVTMQCLPTSGEILYDGLPLKGHEGEIKGRIGLVPQHVNFDQDLTVLENLKLHGRLQHIPRKEMEGRIRSLLEDLELSDSSGDSVRRLSGGMKRRLLIARALLHRPELLFLDEPTVALDPQVRRHIWELIRKMGREGVTILLTTHYIEEAEALCDRVAILDKGRLIALDTPKRLCEETGRVTVEWKSGSGREDRFFPKKEEASVFASGLEGKVLIRPTDLEDVFIKITGSSY